MSMVNGGASVMVVKARVGYMQADAYSDELACVLTMIDNGTLGYGGNGGSWGDGAHRLALEKVAAKVADVRARMDKQDAMDAAPTTPCKECGGPVHQGFEPDHICGD